MQAITCNPAPSACSARIPTVSSVSPKYCRRSEWPTIAPWTPSSDRIFVEPSPVKAPSSAQCTFWAYTVCPLVTAAPSDPNGGQRTASTPPGGWNAAQNSRVAPGPLYIFQLPAISIKRLALRNHGHSGKLLPLEQLESGAAAGRRPRNLVGEAKLVESPDRVGAADDRERVGPGHGLGDRLCPCSEAWPFENAHRAVPEDRFRPRDLRCKALARLGPDVEAQPPFRKRVVRANFQLGVRLERSSANDVRGQDYLEVERVLVPKLFRHLAADQDGVGLATQLAQDAELVLHLGAAGNDHERSLDFAEQLAELIQLTLEQQACVRRQQLGHAYRGGVGPVNRPEPVLDEQVA